MNRAVLKKCVVEARLLFAACGLALFAFCWFRVYIVSRVDLETFAEIVTKVWDNLKDYAPVSLSQLLSYRGRIAVGFDEPIVVLCVAIFAIARGSDAISGEINRGSMELLLAQPVSRLQILASHALVTVVGVLLLSAMTWLGTLGGIMSFSIKEDAPRPSITVPGIGMKIPITFGQPEKIRVPMREKVDPDDFLPGAANLAALGICLAGISTFVSAWDRYRWRTIGIVAGFYVIELIAKIAALAIEEVRWLKYLSIFTAYEPQKFVASAGEMPSSAWSLVITGADSSVSDLGPLGYHLILVGIGLACYVAAAVVFQKRDLPAPL